MGLGLPSLPEGRNAQVAWPSAGQRHPWSRTPEEQCPSHSQGSGREGQASSCSPGTCQPDALRPQLTRRLPARSLAPTEPALTPATAGEGPAQVWETGRLGRSSGSRARASCWPTWCSCSNCPNRKPRPLSVPAAQTPWRRGCARANAPGSPRSSSPPDPPTRPGSPTPAPTWENRPQPKGALGRGDAADNAVEQETDLLSLGRGQEEDPSPCRGRADPGVSLARARVGGNPAGRAQDRCTGTAHRGLSQPVRHPPPPAPSTAAMSPQHCGDVSHAGGSGHTPALPGLRTPSRPESRLHGLSKVGEGVLPAGPKPSAISRLPGWLRGAGATSGGWGSQSGPRRASRLRGEPSSPSLWPTLL